MNKEQFGQFWEQLKAPLKAKWVGISDKDLVEIEGNLDTFRTILPKRYGELRKDEVLEWTHQRYCHWSGNYTGCTEQPSPVETNSLSVTKMAPMTKGVKVNMKRIVINRSYDEFCISHQALVRLREWGQREALNEVDSGAYWPQAAGPREPSLNQYGKLIPRDDENLVRVVEELGEAANGHAATLKIVTIPDDVKWVITKNEGVEQVSEAHRTWGAAT